MQNRVYVVGFGPGKKEYMTIEAASVIEMQNLIVGYTTYVNLLKEEFPRKRISYNTDEKRSRTL